MRGLFGLAILGTASLVGCASPTPQPAVPSALPAFTGSVPLGTLHSKAQRWPPLRLPIDARLAAAQWHTIRFGGEIVSGAVHYSQLVLDGVVYVLDVTAPSISEPSDDKMAAAVQLDGNAFEAPYEVFIDRVNLT